MTTTISQNATEYLCRRYDVEADAIRVEGDSIHVTGTMPNTDERGEFFAGYVADVEREAARD